MKVEKPKLNSDLIKNLLKTRGKTQEWLSTQAGVSKQIASYDIITGCLTRYKLYAKVLGLDPKDLIR